jgi:hypothetical protein
MSEQLSDSTLPVDKRKWYEHSPRELVARALGGTSIKGVPKEPISTRIANFLCEKKGDKWSEERFKPDSWRRMPPGMRSAKGGLGLDQTADSTVEPGLVIELKEGGAKERTGKRILAKREARERGD